MQPYLGMVFPFAFNYAPRGYANCNGALLPINSNQALFALLGTNYGGNGTTNFGLPNLQGRFPVGQGVGSNGIGTYTVGEMGGNENVTMTLNNLPPHTHTATIHAVSNDQSVLDPSGNDCFLGGGGTPNMYSNALVMGSSLTAPALTVNGGSQPISIMSGYVAMMYCIATSGLFPSRN